MDWLSNPIVQGAVTGAATAAAVDWAAFKAWKKWQDIVTYDWSVATFRWVQGAVVGAVTAAGFGALLGV